MYVFVQSMERSDHIKTKLYKEIIRYVQDEEVECMFLCNQWKDQVI